MGRQNSKKSLSFMTMLDVLQLNDFTDRQTIT